MTSKGDASLDALIERTLRGEASPEEVARLTAWREESPANEQYYQRTVGLIESVRALAPEREPVPARPSATAIVARAKWPGPKRSRGWHGFAYLPWTLAAAAALVLALSIGKFDISGRAAPAEVVTGAGELATLTLVDGTVVRLAPSSRLRITSDRMRDVTLEGRAFFAVTHMPDQPFRVHTHDGTAHVLGTRFDLESTENGVRLRVVEGRVALEAAAGIVEVNAGEESAIQDGVALAPTTLGSDAATSWLGRFLTFQTTPLSVAVGEIERLYDVRVVVADSTLVAATITATFTDRPIDQVMAVICEVLSARCTTHADTVRITQ